MRFLVAESEPPADRDRRRASVGRSAGETFLALLQRLVPGVRCDRATPADADADVLTAEQIQVYDAVFLTGSPLHLYDDSAEVRREIAFMRAVFASGTPSFGSCAGLQVAVVAAGGSVRRMSPRQEVGFARRITPTEAGRSHPLLAHRPPAFDAPAVHGDEVAVLPPGATLLAGNAVTRVQAAEIVHDRGIFWGVQYHPELSIGEIAAALRRQGDELIAQQLARTSADIEEVAALLDALEHEPRRPDLRWRLGIDGEVADGERRHREITNFIDHLVARVRRERGDRAGN